MSILLSLLLAQARVLPEVDRRALDLQARAEAIQNQRQAPTRATRSGTAQARTTQTRAAQTRATPQRTTQARSAQASVAQPAATRPRTAPTRPATTTATTTARRPAVRVATHPATTRSTAQRAAAVAGDAANPVRPASIRRASGGALDLTAITTICRAAGNQADPAGFLTTMTRAYSLDNAESQSLRTSCAAYLAGRADARTSNYGVPAH